MSRPRIAIISAVADNGMIGRDNKLLWRLREDMRIFRRLTTGHAVIMGRKTWESLGRPLPDRRNIVITRQANFGAPGAEIVHSLDDAISRCIGDEQIFILGGGQIYAQALPIADVLYLSKVHCRPKGDTAFPEFDTSQWVAVAHKAYAADEFNEYDFDFVTLQRAHPLPESSR